MMFSLIGIVHRKPWKNWKLKRKWQSIARPRANKWAVVAEEISDDFEREAFSKHFFEDTENLSRRERNTFE